jgi:hypothetical protein
VCASNQSARENASRRRSVTLELPASSLSSPPPLAGPVEQLSTLLSWGLGITGYSFRIGASRILPTPEPALNASVRGHVIVREWAGLPCGVYRYDPFGHTLVLQDSAADAESDVAVIVSVRRGPLDSLGPSLIEAGRRMARLLLLAECLGLKISLSNAEIDVNGGGLPPISSDVLACLHLRRDPALSVPDPVAGNTSQRHRVAALSPMTLHSATGNSIPRGSLSAIARNALKPYPRQGAPSTEGPRVHCYAVVNRVDGFQPGVYRLVAHQGRLVDVWRGHVGRLLERSSGDGRSDEDRANVVFYVVADVGPSSRKRHSLIRGLYAESGLVAERVGQESAIHCLGIRMSAEFEQEMVQAALGLYGTHIIPILAVTVADPRPAPAYVAPIPT